MVASDARRVQRKGPATEYIYIFLLVGATRVFGEDQAHVPAARRQDSSKECQLQSKVCLMRDLLRHR